MLKFLVAFYVLWISAFCIMIRIAGIESIIDYLLVSGCFFNTFIVVMLSIDVIYSRKRWYESNMRKMDLLKCCIEVD